MPGKMTGSSVKQIARCTLDTILSLHLMLLMLLSSGLPLVVALLPDQRLHGGLPVCLRRALLLLQAADRGRGQHHTVLRLHHDHGAHILPLHRSVLGHF